MKKYKHFILGFITAAILFMLIPVGAAIQEYICYIADYSVIINGEEYTHPDLPILNYQGNTYAPLRSVLEAAGLEVNWNGELREASIISPTVEKTWDLDNIPLNNYGLPDFEIIQFTAIDENGINVIYFDEVKYVGISSLKDAMKPLIIYWRFGTNPKIFDLYASTSAYLANDEPLIYDIPYVRYMSEYYILNDYYVETIIPLINTETDVQYTVITTEFSDANLLKIIRKKLNKPTGDITNIDVETITNLYASSCRIFNLEGIQYLHNLERLDLNDNKISNIKPLSILTKITTLSLGSNELTNIKPLESLIELRHLSLGFNNISDIKPLSKLSNLETLILFRNKVSDISPLLDLENLFELSIGQNPISNYSLIDKFKNPLIIVTY
jgi:hypothetical protein